MSNTPTVLEPMSASSQTLSMNKRSSDVSNDVSQSWFTTKDDKMALQSKGASWKQGQWTKDEIEILMTNINNYCKEHNINDPTEIIFEMSKDERKDFYRTVAKGLQRPLFSVYRRVTRMYDQKNHMGKYSPEEMAKLRELQMKFGNDWASIGASLGRSASSVKDKCRLMRDTCNSGKWLPEEERRLAEAVYEFAGIKPGQNVTSGLSWANVAERVVTRSEKQCRTKWLNYLNWKQKGGTDWTREDDINLVLKIAAFNVSDDSEIDWNNLSKNWPSVRSPQWLRGKWWSLKRHVPDYQILPFNDLIEYLKTVHLRNVHMKYPLGGNFKVAKENLTRSVSSSDMTFHIPVPLATTASLEGSMDSESFQAYEVLHQTGSGAYLITQPQSNPAISISGATLGSDHIIVHSLPTTNLRGTESMAVQMNTASPVIISSSTGETVPSADINTISIQDVVTPSQEDPMLPSGGTDLIGSSSDVEADKSTPHDTEHDTDITTADIGESAN
ncbi:hypothetical protein KUTeg_021213 [Tegillarca granosa]|uniref:Cyclin-D-binding Myb-like transcription factor 1 n=1 Tax=Tegillarca granosa TaxID=220873 RepID=A0ABQ9EA56_TEGGR|nr:hypothetical protein KUTeg_021213 [Tegillarca granosa]